MLILPVVGLLAWVLPGAGHFVLGEKRRAIIIFVTIVLTFCIGLYVGSIGVIRTNPWYVAQIMISPMAEFLRRLNTPIRYPVYGKPNEIGQIYTSIAGLLNLLCIVNAVYLAHLKTTEPAGKKD